jgi:hypothetical protein
MINDSVITCFGLKPEDSDISQAIELKIFEQQTGIEPILLRGRYLVHEALYTGGWDNTRST